MHDHLTGALLGTATGDALGAGYEFTRPGPDTPIVMHDGGPFGFDTGEWTDDTAMALAVAQAGAEHRLDTPAGLDAVARRFVDWYDTAPKDIGGQTFRVLSHRDHSGAAMTAHAEATGPDNAGNGSLMRTAAVPAALAHDTDPAAMLRAARSVSALTHTGDDTHHACQIWSLAIWRAIRAADGALPDLRDAAAVVIGDGAARERWTRWIDAAEQQTAPEFEHDNGWVVSALQTAWWGIHRTYSAADGDGARHVRDALAEVIRAGHDTDTTAAIAGGLLGAMHGAAALPTEWTDLLFGWPGLDAAGIRALADRLGRAG